MSVVIYSELSQQIEIMDPSHIEFSTVFKAERAWKDLILRTFFVIC